MKSIFAPIFFGLLAILAIAAMTGSPVFQSGLVGDSISGGRLYDNWMVALDLKAPTSDQPLWALQDENPRNGQVTWRCKECHGWDYKGSEGAYGIGSFRFTGFPELSSMIGASQEDVIAWLDGSNNASHNFIQFLDPNAINDLSAFLRTMQIDLALIIDYETGQSLGEEQNGSRLYAAACSDCHGPDGTEINFSSGGLPLYVGDLASVDPWHTVHVVRFGSPPRNMPGTEARGWSLRNVADLLAFAQTFPRGNPSYRIMNDTRDDVSIDRQGEMQPLLLGVILILAVIGSGLLWDSLSHPDGKSP
ncbi:MAG: c-type cytochrome [Chloroflexi bacterium]|nr:c-type cytochrome [Chloroflexota bacterium]